jgi:putative transposase
MDFQFDATAYGRRLKFLNVLDEHSRLCLAIRVGRRCKAKDVVAVLEELTSLYPAPAFIRSDNGSEFISQSLRSWCEVSSATIAYNEPGSLRENGFGESFNARFGDEFLNNELFTTAPEAQLLADRWRWEYNTFRPHSALQGRTPLESSSTRSCSMTTPTRSHKHWTDKVSHFKLTLAARSEMGMVWAREAGSAPTRVKTSPPIPTQVF